MFIPSYKLYPSATCSPHTTTVALESAQSECKEQLEKIDQLEQELFELSGEIAGGRHVPPGVRILSFQDTPDVPLRDNVQTRQAEMVKTKEENAALIRRIEELQRGGARVANNDADGESGDLVPRQSWDAVCKERDELKGVVAQKEKRLKRLQEVRSFRSRTPCPFAYLL